MLVRGANKPPVSMQELLGAELMTSLDHLDILSRKIFAGKLPGERRSKKRGQSVEFEDYRQYTPGYDIRHIDWKVYARLDRLFVKLFLEEEDLSLHIAIDASASMNAGDPDKLRFCQRLAMALGYIGLVRNNRVGMTVFGAERIHRLRETRGRRNLPRLSRFVLESVEPGLGASGTGADFTSALRAIARSRQGRGVMVLLSDFLIRRGCDEGLRQLAGARGFDTYCLQVLSPGEVDPQKERDEALGSALTGDLRLTDVETGDAAEVTITAALLRRYKQRLERHCAQLASFCAAREMHHILLRSDADIRTLLLDQLRRRGMLR